MESRSDDQPEGLDRRLRAHLVAAEHFMDIGRDEAALVEIERALALAPENASLHAKRAWVLADLGRCEQALDAAGRSLALDPEGSLAHVAWACAAMASHRPSSEAVAAARTAVELEPDSVLARYELVRAELFDGNSRAARAGASELLARAPDRALSHVAMAQVEIAASERGSGIPAGRLLVLLLIVCLMFPPLFLAWYASTRIRRAHRLRSADRHIHTALSLEPENPRIRKIAAEILAGRRRYTRSLDHLVAAAASDPETITPRALLKAYSHRLSIGYGVAGGVLILALYILGALVAADALGSVAAGSLAGAFTLALLGFGYLWRRRLLRSLPRELQRDASRRPIDVIWLGGLVAFAAAMFAVSFDGTTVTDTRVARYMFLAGAEMLALGLAGTACGLWFLSAARRLTHPT